jgi:leucyl-tRNA---protein transferase
MRHSLPLSPQFYVTAPQPCPYLDGRVERKLFTALQGDEADTLNNALSRQGFRRSQNVLYRPSCAECSACLSARIVVADFLPSRTQRRILRRNEDVARNPRSPWATEDQYEVFRKYLNSRHAGGGMADMDIFEYAAMVEETPVSSRVVEYGIRPEAAKADSTLAAVCLTDVLEDGLSLVYSFFDPSLAGRSLGTYMILDHVEIARDAGLDYVYLGYWVPGSSKMDYKARFRPLEIFRGREWKRLRPGDAGHDLLEHDPIAHQVAAIDLPPTSEV